VLHVIASAARPAAQRQRRVPWSGPPRQRRGGAPAPPPRGGRLPAVSWLCPRARPRGGVSWGW